MTKKDKTSVRVRMYRQGLGDCFLLTFKRQDKDDFNMLIDCGLLQGTKNGTQIMQRVVADIEDTLTIEKTIDGEKKKWLDVVALTHEHVDHISGFSQAREIFDRIHFGEVWAGWMDDERHPKYKAVREHFHKQVAGLQAALAKMTSEKSQGLKETVRALVHDFFDEGVLGAKGGGRSPSWDYALKKSVNDARFFSPGAVFTIEGVENMRVYILGPPEDFASFSQVDPPTDETYRSENNSNFALADSFFAAAAGADGDDIFEAELFQPFEDHLRVKPDAAQKCEFFETRYGFASKDANEWRRIDDDWLTTAGGLALNLDNFTNNTCLALAIEFVDTGRVMLFPGDAQFANWISWQKLSWEITDQNGTKQQIKAEDLLKRTVLYKVGHHGSHNATLKKHGLEMMTHPDLAALIPVDQEKAKSKTSKTNPKGWEMPEKNLFARLLEKTRGRVILADESDAIKLKTRCQDNKFVSKVKFGGASIKDLKDSSNEEPLYVEVTVE